jgi:hypothetical protein
MRYAGDADGITPITLPNQKESFPMDEDNARSVPQRSKEEIALELMKFVAVTTGYGKGAPAAGYTGKPTKTPEEYADALLQLYQRCRAVLNA